MFKNLDIARLGISGSQRDVIELSLSHKFKGMNLDLVSFARDVERQGLDAARRLIDSARIRLGAFRLPFRIEDDAAYAAGLGELPKLAELAATCGCQRCLATVESTSHERAFQQNFDLHRKRLGEVAAALEPHGVQLGLEFNVVADDGQAQPFIQSFDALLMLVKSAMSANLGVVVDLWAIHASGGSIDQLRLLTVRDIVAVIVSDAASAEKAAASERVLPGGDKVIDVAGALHSLATLGFDGPVMPAASSAAFGQLGRSEKLAAAREALDAVWKEAGLTPRGRLAEAGSASVAG